MNIKKITLILALSALPLAGAFCQTLSDSLVYYYPFNGNAKDASGNNNDLTVNGATLTKDRFGNTNSAYYFNGSAGLFAPFSMAGFKAMTITAWVKTSYTAQQATILFFEGSTVMYTNRFTAGKVFTAFDGSSADNSASQESTTKVNDDNWVFVTAVNDGSTAYTYINGKQESFYSEKLVNKTGTMGIGQQLNNLWGFVGSIDDVRIYNRAITKDEIDDLYKSNPAAVKSNNLMQDNAISIYPNPANNVLNINFAKAGKGNVTISDMSGKICYSEALNTSTNTKKKIDIATMKSGVYFVKIVCDNFIETQKIIVE